MTGDVSAMIGQEKYLPLLAKIEEVIARQKEIFQKLGVLAEQKKHIETMQTELNHQHYKCEQEIKNLLRQIQEAMGYDPDWASKL